MLLNWIDYVDLSGVHVLATLVGMLLSVYASHATWRDKDSSRDSATVRYGQRIFYPALALSLLWSLDYSNFHGVSPWPPSVAIIVAIDVIIAMRIMALRDREKQIAARGWERPFGVDRGARDL